MLFTCAHVYTRTTHAHACALYLDIQAKPKAFLRAHTRVLQGIYIRGRTYAHTRAQISKNIYCIHYYDSRPISTRQHREPAAAYTFTFCHGLMSMQKLSYTSNVSAFFCINKKISWGRFQFRYTLRFSIVFWLQVISVYMWFSGVNVLNSVTFVKPLSVITKRYICSLRYNKFLLHLDAFFALNIWKTCDCVVYLYKAKGNRT